MLLGFEALGLDIEALRAAAKITEAELDAIDGTLPVECFGALWMEAFRQAPREELPSELGFAVPVGQRKYDTIPISEQFGDAPNAVLEQTR